MSAERATEAASILITGGCGFWAPRSPRGHARPAIRSQRPTCWTAPTVRSTRSDTDAISALVADLRPEVIVHLAAGLTDAGERDPVATTRLNALGTTAIFTAAEAARTERVVYARRRSRRSARRRAPSATHTRLNPGNVYGATKAFCEHLAAAMCTRPNAPAYLGLRFGYVYGPGRVRGWRDVQMIVERVRAGERHLVYPDYPDPLDWTWIDDAAEVLLRTCEQPLPRNAVANVVGDKRHVRDAIAHLQRRFRGLTAEGVPARAPPAAWGAHQRRGLEGLLGYVPSTTLERGIDRMLAA